MTAVTFPAEIKKTTSRKTASGDMVYQVVLESWDPTLMNLAVIAPDVLVDVTVEQQGNG